MIRVDLGTSINVWVQIHHTKYNFPFEKSDRSNSFATIVFYQIYIYCLFKKKKLLVTIYFLRATMLQKRRKLRKYILLLHASLYFKSFLY